MDFQKLLQQANSNQKLVERKYEKEQHARVEEQHRQERKKAELKKKAAAKLKEAEEQARKEKLRYHGIVESHMLSQRIAPLHGKSVATSSTSTGTSSKSSTSSIKLSTSKSHSHKSMPPSSSKDQSIKKSSITGDQQKSKSGSKKSLPLSLATSASKHSTDKTKPGKQVHPSTHKKTSDSSSKGKDKGKSDKHLSVGNGSSRSSHSRSASPRSTLISKHSSKTAKPSNFSDLLKAAQSNTQKSSKDGVLARTADARTKGYPSSLSSAARSSSPVGKSLLERNHQRAKGGVVSHHPLPKIVASSSSRESVKTEPSHKGKEGKSVTAQGKVGLRDSSLVGRTDLARRPLKDPGGRTSSPSVDKRAKDRSAVGSRSSIEVKGQRVPSAPSVARSHLRGPPQTKGPGAGSRPAGVGRGGRGTAAASAFYGSAAARILGKDGGSKQSRPSGLGQYKSSWVDEMTDYLRSNDFEAEGYSDEEDEDDLDGFVASDDEEEDMEDYSTEISKIFGYDRRKYRDTDDIAMESSYAQQEYEEIRSARIGRAEDDEELAREKLELQRKRKKQNGKLPATKKTKLGY